MSMLHYTVTTCGPPCAVPPQAGLLILNSLLILHRRRFLAKYGLDNINNLGSHPSEQPLKVQAIGLLQAVQYMRMPVIGANILTIIFELLLGGK